MISEDDMKIINVVGARPNFMKIAPLVKVMSQYEQIEQVLVHTGQHYDDNMSKLFFDDLLLPKPDIYLEVGSASHAVQTASIMVKFEKILMEQKPDLVLVVGDVNSTIACALVGAKLGIPVAHVEAGLRSFDKTMPEEINRVLTDSISEYLFVSEQSGVDNLLNEGVSAEKIFFVGNVMIDTLLCYKSKAKGSKILEKLEIDSGGYALMTMHRPGNVDSRDRLDEIFDALGKIQDKLKIVFPVHPRTLDRIKGFGFDERYPFLNTDREGKSNFITVEPLGYLDFLHLMSNAKFVLTDSGGIQEETTVLGVPCLTLRENTERPATVNVGTNTILGTDCRKIVEESARILQGQVKTGGVPVLWDGKAAQRIVDVLLKK